MKAQLLTTIDNSSKYTLAVAEAMPGNRFHFKPAENVWSFLELINHIGYGIYWWQDNYIKKVKADWNPPAVLQTKEETIKYLQQSFNALKETVELANFDEGTLHGVYTTLDHITHHRGQATTYLRCNSITPPDYIF